jgi:hypothetical protein
MQIRLLGEAIGTVDVSNGCRLGERSLVRAQSHDMSVLLVKMDIRWLISGRPYIPHAP